MEDIFGNPTFSNNIEFSLMLDDDQFVQYLDVSESISEIKSVVFPDDNEWHWVTLISNDGNYFARSNPFGPSLIQGYKLYWAEIHSHSQYCDGTNSPEYIYEYGRKAVGLDIASVTSHDNFLTEKDWDEIIKATKNANKPHEYITFLGYEWSCSPENGGDNNIYFLGNDGPLLYSQAFVPGRQEWIESLKYISEPRTLTDVIGDLGDFPVLIIPHCGGRTANFDFYNADKMPVFEIHSCHQNFESYALDAINRDLKFGSIGGSDDHHGGIGDYDGSFREPFYTCRSGLMGVYAKELTRESIWEAIFAKRVYATNGCKMALSFSINGNPMGSDLNLKIGSKMAFEFQIATDGWFDHAELIFNNNNIIDRYFKKQYQICNFSGAYSGDVQSGTNAYYLRAYQTDGGIAWSSPIWITGI